MTYCRHKEQKEEVGGTEMTGLVEALQTYMEEEKPIVLLTIYERSGSAPRGAGAHMIVGSTGRWFGTIGGGAVEYEAEQRALQVLQEKQSCRAHYYLKQNEVQDLGMVCGGEVDVAFTYLDPHDKQTRQSISFCMEMQEREETAWLILDITDEFGGKHAFYGRKSGWMGMMLPDAVIDKMISAYGTIEENGRIYYYERLTQPGRVYIFGGGHVAQALVPALSAVDFSCVILEDREEFCKPELFPKADRVMKIDMKHISDYVQITDEDYVCVMTRGHKDDTIVQEQILRTQAKYIGVIGSRKKKAAVFRVLKECGLTDEDLVRVTTPIGLEIKAETPAEIAVSITAQMIMVRAGGEK